VLEVYSPALGGSSRRWLEGAGRDGGGTGTRAWLKGGGLLLLDVLLLLL